MDKLPPDHAMPLPAATFPIPVDARRQASADGVGPRCPEPHLHRVQQRLGRPPGVEGLAARLPERRDSTVGVDDEGAAHVRQFLAEVDVHAESEQLGHETAA